jgi:hypothetical protein
MPSLQTFQLEEFFARESLEIAPTHANLFRLGGNGIQVGKTRILDQSIYHRFDTTGVLPDSIVEHLTAELESELHSKAKFRISVDSPISMPQFQNVVEVRATKSELAQGIEMIYRRWFSDELEAYRIVNSYKQDESIPILAIQRIAKRTYKVCSRDPGNGEFTCKENLRAHNGNTVSRWNSTLDSLLRKTESLLAIPVECVVSSPDIPVVWEVKKSTMSEFATIRVAVEMYECNELDSMGLLENIEPWMLVGMLSVRLVGPSLLSAPGFSVGSNVPCMARLLVNSDIKVDATTPYIQAVQEFDPNNINQLIASNGAITPFGMMSSHLAVAARRMGKSVMVCPGMKIDFHAKLIKLPDGNIVPSGTNCFLDCVTGNIVFGEGELLADRKPVVAFSKYYELIETAIDEVSTMSKFRNYSLADQEHIHGLRKVMTEIRETHG